MTTRSRYKLGGHQANKFEHVSRDAHQMSLAGGVGVLRSHVFWVESEVQCPGVSYLEGGQGWGWGVLCSEMKAS